MAYTIYNPDGELRVTELFAGIGAVRQALKELSIPHSSVISEIDRYAIATYERIHGPTENLGDVTKIDCLPPTDLLSYTFPCQDLSLAGRQRGMEEGSGTRSSLVWEVRRLVERDRPPILLMENVDAILNRRNLPAFKKWISALQELGYRSEYRVLNALDFGVPQRRKRCFMISRCDGGPIRWPEPVPLTIRLRDVLEQDVPERYYVSDQAIEGYKRRAARSRAKGGSWGWNPAEPDGVSPAVLTSPAKSSANIVVVGNLDRKFEMISRVYGPEGVSPTLRTCATGGQLVPMIEEEGIWWPNGTKAGRSLARPGDGINLMRPHLARGTVQDQRIATLTTGAGCGLGTVTDDLRIRYLTPLECWRLMGFPDSAYNAAAEICSRTQLYKQAGNSIVVPVLKGIFSALFGMNDSRQSVLEAFAMPGVETEAGPL